MNRDIIERPSPNWDSRPEGRTPDLLILHYTGMQNEQAALDRLCDPAAKVSAHYCIGEDGTLYALVPESRRAWHAGVAAWEGTRDINARSIGIELVNPGHEFGYRPFPEPQISRLVELAADILEHHAIAPWHVLGHSDVAPLRKRDPGELFPWRQLAGAGIGLWPQASDDDRFRAEPGDTTTARQLLADFGYGLDAFGSDNETVCRIVAAVQRHWRPARLDGVADAQTIAILQEMVGTKYSDSPWG